MKYTDFLQDILGSKSRVKILRYLIRTNISINGRQLSRLLGLHHRTCHESLSDFVSFGVVTLHKTGRINLYKINQSNFIVKKILQPIFYIEENIFSVMINNLKKKITVPIVSVIVFGSVAESKERATSDIDMLLLTSTKGQKKVLMRQLEKLEYDFVLEYGNMLSAMVLTSDEFLRRLKRKDALTQEIINEGRAIYGKSIQEVISYASKKNRA